MFNIFVVEIRCALTRLAVVAMSKYIALKIAIKPRLFLVIAKKKNVVEYIGIDALQL